MLLSWLMLASVDTGQMGLNCPNDDLPVGLSHAAGSHCRPACVASASLAMPDWLLAAAELVSA